VLDHDGHVAQRGEPARHVDQARGVARVQADGGLVEDHQRPVSEVPSAAVRATRCTSPPDKVREGRSSVR